MLSTLFLLARCPAALPSTRRRPPWPTNSPGARQRQPAGDGNDQWFDTNYHYLAPEFDRHTTFAAQPRWLLEPLAEARALGLAAKPVLLGPLSFIGWAKARTAWTA